jgi:hypothetical protein
MVFEAQLRHKISFDTRLTRRHIERHSLPLDWGARAGGGSVPGRAPLRTPCAETPSAEQSVRECGAVLPWGLECSDRQSPCGLATCARLAGARSRRPPAYRTGEHVFSIDPDDPLVPRVPVAVRFRDASAVAALGPAAAVHGITEAMRGGLDTADPQRVSVRPDSGRVPADALGGADRGRVKVVTIAPDTPNHGLPRIQAAYLLLAGRRSRCARCSMGPQLTRRPRSRPFSSGCRTVTPRAAMPARRPQATSPRWPPFGHSRAPHTWSATPPEHHSTQSGSNRVRPTRSCSRPTSSSAPPRHRRRCSTLLCCVGRRGGRRRHAVQPWSAPQPSRFLVATSWRRRLRRVAAGNTTGRGLLHFTHVRYATIDLLGPASRPWPRNPAPGLSRQGPGGQSADKAVRCVIALSAIVSSIRNA